jgi:Na+-transporting methylmalonyl-CoA/oxaloacetate decarboxylase gamma subunit
MTDWALAVKIAVGGFGMVFFLLVLLSIFVSAASRLIVRLSRDKAKPLT